MNYVYEQMIKINLISGTITDQRLRRHPRHRRLRRHRPRVRPSHAKANCANRVQGRDTMNGPWSFSYI